MQPRYQQSGSIRPPILYVDTVGGATTNNGLTAGTALKTIAAASTLANARPWVREIHVLPGTYVETITVPRSGLTYRALGSVIIDGNAQANKAVYTANFSDITIIGFAAQNCAWAYDFRAGTNVRFFNCSVSNSLRGFYAIGAMRPLMVQCTATGMTNAFGGFYMSAGTTDALIDQCEASNCASRGIYFNASTGCIARRCYVHTQPNGAYGYEVEASANDCQFLQCWFIGTPALNPNGFISKTSLRTRFDGCVAKTTTSAGFYWKDGDNGWAYNCVADTCTKGFYLATNVGSDPSTGNTIKNCIAINNTYGIETMGGSNSGLTTDYNDFFANAAVAVIEGSAKVTLADYQSAGQEANGRAVDPAYASTDYGGYVLPAGSSLKNAGAYLGGSDLTPDLGREGSTWDGYSYG